MASQLATDVLQVLTNVLACPSFPRPSQELEGIFRPQANMYMCMPDDIVTLESAEASWSWIFYLSICLLSLLSNM